MSFLEDFARWNPSQEATDSRTDLMKIIMQSCRKQPARHEIATGSKTDQAVNAIWAAMVYHTPALNRALKTYGNAWLQWSQSKFHSVYSASCSVSLLYFWIICLAQLIRWFLNSFFFCLSSKSGLQGLSKWRVCPGVFISRQHQNMDGEWPHTSLLLICC